MPPEKFEKFGVPHWWPELVRDIGLHLDIDALREHRDDHLTVALGDAVITIQPGKERDVILTSATAVLPPAPDAGLLATCLAANLHAVRDATPVISIEPDTRAVMLQQRVPCEGDVVPFLTQMARSASALREKLDA